MDFSGKMRIKSLHEVNGSRVYLKNLVPLEDDFAFKVLEGFEKLGPVHFDSLFHEGILDEHGNGELYCSEFIHYAFKNRLDPNSESLYESPYDSINTKVIVDSKSAKTNFMKMGVGFDGNFFIPDTLIYSKKMKYMGHYFNSEWGGYTKPNALWVAGANKEFFKLVKHAFFTRDFKNKNIKDWIKFQLYRNKTKVNKASSKLGKGPLITSREYIDNYYIFKFAELANLYSNALMDLSRIHTEKASWNRAYKKLLEEKIIPRLNDLFN